ncbi:TPA: LOW QUALITY PROTEIN: hypothetical protein N0F65_011347 [Lagenidium giganteum]|uniref:Ubiquitin-like domain-containing protein n=1 Tax=Lagenidium giganteum TaxID=4803 RepID=A0AAV2Z5M5_9STRA|nr:TPA: LOW QUALITY PROTEIN: hypothetical protein N0F65_011347 [Lagenidium giganteum]
MMEHQEQISAATVPLDEWLLVDEQAEDVAPVSTREAKKTGEEGAVKQVAKNTDAQPSGNQVSPVPGQSETSSSEQHEAVNVPEGYTPIRLRVGEGIRPAWFKATQAVDDFINEFFADEVTSNKKIRLIYMGMLLLRGRSMGEYGIAEDGVIHSVITEAPATPHHHADTPEQPLKGWTNPANTLLIVTGFFLYGLWTLFYHFPHLFTWKSLLLLAILSLTHIYSAVSRMAM